MKKNKKKIKIKKAYPRGQFFFNVISMLFLLSIVVTLGIRSFYFYNKQNYVNEISSNQLSFVLKNNREIVSDGPGLYKESGEYYFKGLVDNNYVYYSNRLFRIIKVNLDDSVVLISEDGQTVLPYGDNNSYLESSVRYYLNNIENYSNSGAFLDTLSNPGYYLTNSEWTSEEVVNGEVVSSIDYSSDLVRLLTVENYLNAGGNDSFLNTGDYSFLMSVSDDSNNLYMNKEGSIASTESSGAYGVRPVITMKSTVEISSGDGTLDNPYRLDEEQDITNVLKYVMLGEDKYQIVEDNETTYKLVNTNYLVSKGNPLEYVYGYYTSDFIVNEKYSLALYLNNTLYKSLSYKDLLIDCTFYNGEFSNEKGYYLDNHYNSSVTSKIGLSSIVDLKVNTELSDYYLINKTSQFGQMGFVHNNSEVMDYSLIEDKKQVVTSICINKDVLVSGEGTFDSPYGV